MSAAKVRKIVLIGAGSRCFTAALLSQLLKSEDFDGATIGLVDVDADRLALVEKLTHRLVRETGKSLNVTADTDRRAVLKGADYVTVTISVGGDDAWENDLDIPAGYGVMQSVGDTCGVGGMSRGLRHAPVLVEIARDMEDLCPDAWLINYSNPMSLLTRTVWRETSIRCMGLCVGVDITKRFMSWAIGAPVSETDVWAAGINHFMFAYGFNYGGRDAYPLLRSRIRQALGRDAGELAAQIKAYPGLDIRPDQPVQGMQKFSAAIMDLCGYFPGPGDTHVNEFLPHLFRSPGDYDSYGITPNSMQSRREHTAKHLAAFDEMANGTAPIDISRLGDTAHEEQQVVQIIHSTLGNEGRVFYVNLPNGGQIPNLPPDAIVEGPCRMGAFGPAQCRVAPLPDMIAAWTRPWCAWQDKLIDAALAGSRDLALEAMLMDPGCRGIDTSKGMLDRILEANAWTLPRFERG